MAAVTGRPVLVRVRPALARPDDPVIELDPAADDEPAAERDGVTRTTRLARSGSAHAVEVVVDGWRFELEVEDARQAELREKARRGRSGAARRGPLEVRAIIPGRVVSVDVGVGDRVDGDGHLLVLEAMKMQNELRAPASGTVATIAVTAGQTVDRGDLLLVIEPARVEAGP